MTTTTDPTITLRTGPLTMHSVHVEGGVTYLTTYLWDDYGDSWSAIRSTVIGEGDLYILVEDD